MSNNTSAALPGITWVEVTGIRLYSCYLPPSDTIDLFLGFLDAIVVRISYLPVLSAAYEIKRKELKGDIKIAKGKCWQNFCAEVNREPWA
ncbi:hypothetical protein KM043_008070 [Ampulex compressa]|nr:hypothetical protein KM043_008070 [Ampulex compressa]